MSTYAVTTKLVVAALVLAVSLPAAADAASRDRGRSGDRGASASGGAPQMALQDRISPNPRTASMRSSASAVQRALSSDPASGALRTPSALHDPKTRALVAASLATAVLDRGGDGWWRHRSGGYGWVGPVFWPFASYDIFNYALWGDGYDTSFWDYGYPDLYAGLFGPYPYDDLVGYASHLPQPDDGLANGRIAPASIVANNNGKTTLAQMCGEGNRDIAGLPVSIVQNAMQLNDAQRAALDDLAGASEQASRALRSACPTTVALAAPRRVAVMQQRVEAMIAALQTVQPPLRKFYGLLTDAQKAQLATLATSPSAAAIPAAQACAAMQPGPTDWPTAAIEQSVKPTDEQRKSLDGLRAAAAKAADMLKGSCQPGDTSTPPARLAAMEKRLDAMLQALNIVTAALDDFYGSLDDEQTANFNVVNVMGSPPPSAAPQTAAAEPARASERVSAAEPASASAAKQTATPRAVRRRHIRHAGHFPHPVRMIGRMLFSLLR